MILKALSDFIKMPRAEIMSVNADVHCGDGRVLLQSSMRVSIKLPHPA